MDNAAAVSWAVYACEIDAIHCPLVSVPTPQGVTWLVPSVDAL